MFVKYIIFLFFSFCFAVANVRYLILKIGDVNNLKINVHFDSIIKVYCQTLNYMSYIIYPLHLSKYML